MPAATEQPAAKKEREELLWQSLKEHVMRERQKIKEGNCHTISKFLYWNIVPIESQIKIDKCVCVYFL